ncbi:MAG: hypothetical protein ACI92G_001675 [Candidatus Pelagisphaera sp.]
MEDALTDAASPSYFRKQRIQSKLERSNAYRTMHPRKPQY